MIRKADRSDQDKIISLYERAHAQEEAGRITTGWKRGIYPDEHSVFAALARDDLYVMEEEGKIIGAAILNQIQPEEYRKGPWEFLAYDEEVFVIHTLYIDLSAQGNGYGRRFLEYYEQTAEKRGCHVLRLDTNAINTKARRFYRLLGYREAGIVPTVFNGIKGVDLVLLEKRIEKNCLKDSDLF